MAMNQYNCLGCGHKAQVPDVGGAPAQAKCPTCGSEMFRCEEDPQSAPDLQRFALPSRYASRMGPARFAAPLQPEEPEHNPVILPHTPFIVILGLIFSILPVICVAGLIISIMGLNLVNGSPRGVRGKGLAIAGIAIGAVMCLFTLALMAAHHR